MLVYVFEIVFLGTFSLIFLPGRDFEVPWSQGRVKKGKKLPQKKRALRGKVLWEGKEKKASRNFGGNTI